MISTQRTNRILRLLSSDVLAKDMLVAGCGRKESEESLRALSRRLGHLTNRQRASNGNKPPAVLFSIRHLCIPAKPGMQLSGPVVLDDGSVLAYLLPCGGLWRFREEEENPEALSGLPFEIKAKAMKGGICYCLEKGGSRLCLLDASLAVVDVSDGLALAGVKQPTSFCFFDNYVGVISQPLRKAWILDSDWNVVCAAKMPWVDFLFNPTGAEGVLYAVDCPSSAEGTGGVVGIGLDGRTFSLRDGLIRPLGLAAFEGALLCGHSGGVSVLRLHGDRMLHDAEMPMRALCGALEQDEYLACTNIFRRGESAYLFLDVFARGISGPGRPIVLEMEAADALKAG